VLGKALFRDQVRDRFARAPAQSGDDARLVVTSVNGVSRQDQEKKEDRLTR